MPTVNHAAVGFWRRVRCFLGGEEDGLKNAASLRKTGKNHE